MDDQKVILEVVRLENNRHQVEVNCSGGELIQAIANIIYASVKEGSERLDIPPSYLFSRIMQDVTNTFVALCEKNAPTEDKTNVYKFKF